MFRDCRQHYKLSQRELEGVERKRQEKLEEIQLFQSKVMQVFESLKNRFDPAFPPKSMPKTPRSVLKKPGQDDLAGPILRPPQEQASNLGPSELSHGLALLPLSK